MSGLLLCSSKRSSRPYKIEENEWEIWSLEELCYYLYQNACDIGEEFFSEELFLYLREELQLKELESCLAEKKQANRNVAEWILLVCEAANYYDRQEIQLLEQRLMHFASLGRLERMKYTADSCLRKKRYMHALKRYEAILADKETEPCEEGFLGRVYHNIGVVYANMLFYKEAEEYLRYASDSFIHAGGCEQELQHIRKELCLLAYLAENKGETSEAETMELSAEERERLITDWENIRASVKTEDEQYKTVIEQWKQEYRAQMS